MSGNINHATVTVDAARRRNPTGFLCTAGRRYTVRARGTWTDGPNACDADGYPSDNFVLRIAERLRTVRSAHWFTLIGVIDGAPRSYFALGTERTFTATADGELLCFANDVPFMYWNNRGSIEITIAECDREHP